MDFSAIKPLFLLASIMAASTPIVLAAIGELVVEKAGVLNLGVEGMMITGASAALLRPFCRAARPSGLLPQRSAARCCRCCLVF